jgi:hypothetical protein
MTEETIQRYQSMTMAFTMAAEPYDVDKVRLFKC